MIGYVMVGTNNIKESGAFYDKLLAEFGAERMWEMEKSIIWNFGEGKPFFCITLPYDGKEASVGNGSMIALAAPNVEAVDRIYGAAMEAGATDEGAPGSRGDESMGFYAGYFRDLDGNKLNVYHMKPQG